MRLKDVLKILTHDKYTVVLQTRLSRIVGTDNDEIIAKSDLIGYLDYKVLAIDDSWNIIIQDEI